MIREVWENHIQKELKTVDIKPFTDSIEGVSWDYSNNNPSEQPTDFNHILPKKNPWKLTSYHFVENEKKSNQEIRNDLNFGAEVLLVTWEKPEIDFDILFEGVEFAYIQTYVEIEDDSLLTHLTEWFAKKQPAHFTLLTHNQGTSFKSLPCLTKIDGFDAYSAGANGVTEISWMLYQFEELLKIPSTQSAYFEVGIGENTFTEIAKIKSLQVLIECLKVKHGKPDFKTLLSAKTGWRNKSLKDVHTNQLRHTNESLIAILSGVDLLCITPYDFLDEKGPTEFSRRMAMNVSNLLKEEGHLDYYSQITQGSYITDHLTQQMCDKVWGNLNYLQSTTPLEKQVLQWIQENIEERERSIETKALKMIGINCFLNDSELKPSRKTPHSKLGLPYYFYEKIAL